MAKICEYDEVKCPFCGSEEVEHLTYGRLHFNYTSVDTSTQMGVHLIRCQKCLGQFAIPCED